MEFISDKVKVIDKKVNDFKKDDGSIIKYFNVIVGGMGWSQSLPVNEELFNSIDIDDELRFRGRFGGYKTKNENKRWWTIDELVLGK